MCRLNGIRQLPARLSAYSREGEGTVAVIDLDAVPFAEIAAQQFHGQRVLDPLLNHAFQGPRAVHRVVAFVGDRVACRLGDVQRESLLLDLLLDTHDLQIDDLADFVAMRANGTQSISSMRLRNSGSKRVWSTSSTALEMSFSPPPSSVIRWMAWLPMLLVITTIVFLKSTVRP